MRFQIKPPSASLMVAITALVVALAGGAYAAVRIDTKDIAKKAVTTKKLAGKAVTTPKLGPGAVTSAQLALGERSEGFVTNQTANAPLAGGEPTTIATLNLPAGGTYVVTAGATLGNGAATLNLATCQLSDDGAKMSAGSVLLPEVAVFGETMTLNGASDGGAVTLACQLDNGGQARDRVITAVRVGSLQAQ